MIQVNVSLRDKTTFYLRVDMNTNALHKYLKEALLCESNLSGFITLVDEDGDTYMLRISEIKDIAIYKLSEGDDN
ncbi:MAG: hypothetical protein J6V44_09595 [Methanobrevibacter sp.]|nr:hypothetical protein [Methanobrevibacter sp.]